MFPEIQADVETLITVLKYRSVEGVNRRRPVKHEEKMRYIHGSCHFSLLKILISRDRIKGVQKIPTGSNQFHLIQKMDIL